MCVGHPKRHPCQHTSVTYNHCVAAHFDRDTRVTTPCHNTTYAAPIDTDAKCTNQLCYYDELGGSWTCCQCRNGPNRVGWCVFDRPRAEFNALTGAFDQLTACDHCCCWDCTAYPNGGASSSSGGGGGGSQGGSRHKKGHHGHSSSKRSGASSRHGGGSSSKGGSASKDYQWIEMDYSSKNGSSSHRKKKNKDR